MLNYRKGKERYKVDEYGSLYVDRSKLKDSERPVIYIGGQMEHRCHVLEQTGYTADPGHNMFTGSWFYDYSILDKDKGGLNAKRFGDNLLKALEASGVGSVDLVTESYGGLIGAYASKSPLINEVIAIHPPILGTPLANKDLIKGYFDKLDKQQKLVAKIAMALLDDRYGFEKDNKAGIYAPEIQYAADLTKLLVVGSNIDPATEKNKVASILYSVIYAVSKEKSDGVVTFNPGAFKSLGISYLEEDSHLSHFDAGTEENIRTDFDKAKSMRR